jgi:hypothetical protein
MQELRSETREMPELAEVPGLRGVPEVPEVPEALDLPEPPEPCGAPGSTEQQGLIGAPCASASPEPLEPRASGPCNSLKRRGPRGLSEPEPSELPDSLAPPGFRALLESLLAVWRGKRLWRRVKRERRVDAASCALVLMPQSDLELNTCALRHLDGYLRQKYLKSALVLTHDRAVLAAARELASAPPGSGVRAQLAPERDIGCICKYYCFAQFAKHIVVVSLDEPYGSGGLLAKKGCSLDDIVTGSILGFH